MVIAIDGPGGVGKSSVAQGVAARLNIAHLDTGSTYRAATLAVVRAGVNPSDRAGVIEVVRRSDIDYRDGVVHLDGVPVGREVRTQEVTSAVSAVAEIAEVRELVVEIQRSWVSAHGNNAVVDGRDIGTVVFPDATLKVYLTARAEVRAKRRAGDVESDDVDIDAIAADLRRRDHHDSTRAVSPLRPADDAVVFDTSDLDLQQVIEAVVELAKDHSAGDRSAEG